jgi:GntR family transcriptional regulator/MocR family aminotransferase
VELMLPLETYEQKYKFKYLALYHCLRDLIFSGNLPHGTRLPSTRELAETYRLSRGMVNQAYEMLLADSYIETKQGSGTFISFTQPKSIDCHAESFGPLPLSEWGNRLPQQLEPAPPSGKGTISFSTGTPCMEQFPVTEWKKAVKQGAESIGYLMDQEEPSPLGLSALRESLAAYLLQTRGMKVDPELICIVNGSIHAMAVLIHLLVSPGEKVLVENPTYKRMRNVIEAVGGIPSPIPLHEGFIAPGESSGRLVFVSPSFQYPTGKVMSLEERLTLLEWAQTRQALIIEDDSESEFRRKGRPIEPLKVLDYGNRVVYLGTFYRTLLPFLRIGFAVLPPDLKEPFLKAKHLFEPFTTSLLEQAAVAMFMKNGSFSRHVRRMKRIYTHKYHALRTLFDRYLPGVFTWSDAHAGLHLFGWWNGTQESLEAFTHHCALAGVTWEDPSPFFLEPSPPAAIFGFSHLSQDEMERAIKIMRMFKIYR